jgi:HEPN domain-containing protein
MEPNFSDLSKIKKLDQYYIAARYPNGLPDNIPHEYYSREDAEECLKYAGQTISLIEKLIK